MQLFKSFRVFYFFKYVSSIISFSVLKKYGYRSMYVIVGIDKEYMASCVCKQPYKISSFKHWQFISWYEAIGTIYLFKQP